MVPSLSTAFRISTVALLLSALYISRVLATPFAKDFLFGSSTSSYQIEGAWNESGKGENIWDRLVHTRSPAMETGDVTCDSYHLFEEDIVLMKDIGFDVYRFSISWSRILPNGEITQINEAGVTYYRALISELLKNGIQPMVTMYHWDLPQRLQDLGGWANPLIVDYMEDYADLLFSLYGNQVKWWLTINEPDIIVWGYMQAKFAPALNLGPSIRYIVGHNILRAHGRVFRLYDEKYRKAQNGKVSLCIHTRNFIPKTDSNDDQAAAKRSMIFSLDWFAHPIFSEEGDYPPLMRQMVDAKSKQEGRRRSKLPTFTHEEIVQIRGSYDFFALNHYSTLLASFVSPKNEYSFVNDYEDSDVRLFRNPDWPRGHSLWFSTHPKGLENTLRYIKDVYRNPPLIITENGYCGYDGLNDTERISYHKDHLAAVSAAINEHGCQVIGYVVWSLLDNLEWASGYGYRFGLIHVDFEDPRRKRTPKLSAQFFKQLLNNRTMIP